MPAALAPFIATFLGVGLTTATVIATVVVNLAVSFLLTKVASLLSPSRSRTSGLQAQQFTVNDSIAPRTIIYGETKTSGTLGFIATSSKPGSNKNEYLWVVILLADHQCESITDIWLDAIKIPDASINSSTGLVTGGLPDWNGKLYIWKHLGTSAQTADTNLNAAFTTWNAAPHPLTGVAYIVVRMERDPKVFTQGNPQNYFAKVRGKRLYDCRLDSTNGGSGSHRLADPRTWAWSANTALCVADYITGGSCYYDTATIPDVARRGLNDSRVDWTQVAASANYSDDSLALPGSTSEKRYSCNGILTTMLTHSENMGRILSSAAAVVAYTGGLYRVFVGRYDTPTISIDDDDLTGAIEVSTSVGENGLYNAVSAVFTDKDREFQSVTSYMRTNPGYEAADGRREPITIDLPMVVTDTHAQRLCEIENRQGRNQTVITANLGLNGFKIPVWSTFTGIFAEFGYVAKVFRCTNWALDPSTPGVQIIARDEYPITYPDFITDPYGTPTNTGIGNQFDLPDAPSLLQTTSLVQSILVAWESPTTVFANTKYQLQESTSSAMTTPVVVYEGADRQATIGKTILTAFYYRVRVTRDSRFSDWEPPSGGVSGKALSTPAGGQIITALSASAAPGSVSATVSIATATTQSAVITAAGGTPAYTYAWTWLTGGTGLGINNPSFASTSVSAASLAVGETRTGVMRCTVTDTIPASVTVDVAVTISRLSFTVLANNVVKLYISSGGSALVSSSPKIPNTVASGGTPAYTYLWTLVSTSSGTTPTIIGSATNINPYWQATVAQGTSSISTWKVTATDSLGATATATITVSLNYESFA